MRRKESRLHPCLGAYASGADKAYVQATENQEDADTDEALLLAAEKWEPDPVDADVSVDTQTQDVISMLVGIYGSKELFINEYRCAWSSPEITFALLCLR